MSRAGTKTFDTIKRSGTGLGKINPGRASFIDNIKSGIVFINYNGKHIIIFILFFF